MTIEPVLRVFAAISAPYALIGGYALAAGGYADLHDAAALLAQAHRDRIVREVETRIGEVQPDVRALWRDLLKHRARP